MVTIKQYVVYLFCLHFMPIDIICVHSAILVGSFHFFFF